MIYSFWAFKSCTVFCDKGEMKHFKMKAVKDPEENQNLRERWTTEGDTLKMNYLILEIKLGDS